MPDLNFRFAPIYTKAREVINLERLAVQLQFTIANSSLPRALQNNGLQVVGWNLQKGGGYPDFTLSVWSLDMIRWMFESEIKTVEWVSNYPRFE
jgi:predicted dehydrogenase